ncbi:MAG: hypothetical protein K2X52_11285 [Mycobacteriaceae bacterium]|nr:hypothetical protein [Mycobacteriaceae bacterium]
MKPSTAIFGGLIFGGFGVFTAAWTALFILRGELLNAVVALGVSAFCFGLIIPMFAVVPGNVAPRVDVDDVGTTFRPDRAVDLPIQIALVGVVIAAAVYTIFAPAGMVTIPVPPVMRYWLPFTSGVVLLISVRYVWRNFRRGSISYLRLTPSGFEFAQDWRPQYGDWDQVKDVTEEAPGQQAPTPGFVVCVMSDDSAPSVAARSYTPNGRALRELIRFYWKHPESRDELTDGRAVERLAQSLA